MAAQQLGWANREREVYYQLILGMLQAVYINTNCVS